MAIDDPVLAEVDRLLAPILESAGARLYDLERQGGLLKVTVDRDGGVDLDVLTEVNRELGRALDEADPIPGSYTLEVSSPGLERTLRTEAHWRTAVGERVKVKLRPDASEVRRLDGTIDEVGDGFATVVVADGTRSRFELAHVERAKTVFEWQAQPKHARPGPRPRGG
jgi:ribosome maturation factor RimP